MIRNRFKNVETKFILLIADDNTLIERDNKREEDCRMGKRVLILKEKLINQNFTDKHILNTTNMSIEETVKEIDINELYNLEVTIWKDLF